MSSTNKINYIAEQVFIYVGSKLNNLGIKTFRKLILVVKQLVTGWTTNQQNMIKTHLQDYLSCFSLLNPNDQNSFDLFEGSWSTKIPNIQNTGEFDGFNDERITWLLEEIGAIEGKSVLEFGPLEGGHTYMLEKAGAEVTSIEANHGAFLRCLTVKNFLGLRSRFVLGDFSKIDLSNNRFQLVVACGVLYHMADPISLLKSIANNTNNIFIWTHYFDENFEKWSPEGRKQLKKGKWDLKNIEVEKFNELEVRTVRQKYGQALGWTGFCGGTETFSYWVYRQDLLAVLKELGFINIRINFDKIDHPNGPCFAIIASKFDTTYYLDPSVNPDLSEVFGKLSSEEKESQAIEHFNVYGRKEGRSPIAP